MPKVYPTNKVWQSNPFANLVPLFTNPAWTKHANAQASPDGKTLTLNATGPWQSTTYRFPLIPPAAYVLTGDIAKVSGVGSQMVIIKASVGGVIRDVAVLYTSSVPVNIPAGAQWVDMMPTASDSGTFTFSNLTLRRVQPTPVAANFQEFFKELVVNGNFSQGATGWSGNTGPVAFSNGQVVLGPGFSGCYQDVSVSPNTAYQLISDRSGTNPLIELHYYDVSMTEILPYGQTNGVAIKGTFTFTTPLRCSTVRVRLYQYPAGAGTTVFDNISLKRAMPT